MGESDNSKKASWFTGLKMEFKKIIWPDKKTLGKQTLVVLVTAICIGIIVALLDMGLQYGIRYLINL